ncbi:glycogen debranching protein [Candidatus Woesearchaeota archaeon]|nr:MAG: glycogen debranching protein [Candidatus Woesearchaeota archaeon]
MDSSINREEAYSKSLSLLKNCSTRFGFLASLEKSDNYKRIWARDSMITSLAALLTDSKPLHRQVKYSLLTLCKYQHKHGMIPSNVEPFFNKVSYGGSAGRIDSLLWFLIGFGQYVKRTNDRSMLKRCYKKFKRSYSLVHLYEFNEKGFIYVPQGGDWADQYINEGYILYDQLLYYKALEEFIYVRKRLGKDVDKYENILSSLRKKILVNYWLEKRHANSKYVYNKVLYKIFSSKKNYSKPYLLPYFNPSGYGNRFDAFANILALHFNILSDVKKNSLLNYISLNFSSRTKHLIPAFYPVITSKDREWDDLRNNYLTEFRNKPYHYHNGGLWPMLTAFYACYLSHKNKPSALKYLDAINHANSLPSNSWHFHEYLSGKSFRALGTKYMAWNAASSIMAYECIINNKRLFL